MRSKVLHLKKVLQCLFRLLGELNQGLLILGSFLSQAIKLYYTFFRVYR